MNKGIDGWKCCYCGEVFSTRSKLYSHRPCPKKPEYHWICKDCGNEFNTEAELRVHRRSCSSIKVRDGWKCDECDLTFHTRRELSEHRKEVHRKIENGKLHNINKGKQKPKSEYECPFCHRKLFTCISTFNSHVNHCESNPDRKIYKIRKLSEGTKKKISESMKIAQKEGRAHNIGYCVWNKQKSYPEEWMTSVIENEFNDHDYEYNFQVGPYKLDFAWPKKMRYIEIDGDQHYVYEYNIEKDKRRDKYLEDRGWTLLR